MKILLINTDPRVHRAVEEAVVRVNGGDRPATPSEEEDWLKVIATDDQEAAIEYIHYQMPPLIVLNCSDQGVDPMRILRHVAEDPWLNQGGIVALYADHATLEQVSARQDSNIIIHLAHHELESPLSTVLGIVRDNRQILFQRALQTDLLGAMHGQFDLAPDVMLVPAYANLVANYQFNMGFMDRDMKARVSLVLTEMLMNAIEHGNCEISFEEKRAHLDNGGLVQDLILERCQDPSVRIRRVHYSFDIYRTHSVHVIRDQGKGFDWRHHMDGTREVDALAEHGRGILLARQTVDRMQYNDVGNEVTLEFRHAPQSAQIPSAFQDAEVVTCGRDDVIFKQGESSDFLYYVAEGSYRVLVDGRHVANLTPADVLMGEMSLLLEERRSATVIADTPGRLIRISRQDFIKIIKNQPYYGMLLARLLAQRLHRLGRGVLA